MANEAEDVLIAEQIQQPTLNDAIDAFKGKKDAPIQLIPKEGADKKPAAAGDEKDKQNGKEGAEEGKPSFSDDEGDVDQHSLDKMIDAIDIDESIVEKKDADKKPEEEVVSQKKADSDAAIFKKLSEKYGAKVESVEDIDALINYQQQVQSELSTLNTRKAQVAGLLSLSPTDQIVRWRMINEGETEAEAKEYVDLFTEEKGERAVKLYAKDIANALRKEQAKLDNQIQTASDRVKNSPDFAKVSKENEEKSRQELKQISQSLKSVYGISIDKSKTDAFEQALLSGAIGDELQKNPQKFVEMLRFHYEGNDMIRSVASKAKESGFKKGFEKGELKERAFWENKLHNKPDPRLKFANGQPSVRGADLTTAEMVDAFKGS